MNLERRVGRVEATAAGILDRLHRQVGESVAGMVERVLGEVDDLELRERLRGSFARELYAFADRESS